SGGAGGTTSSHASTGSHTSNASGSGGAATSSTSSTTSTTSASSGGSSGTGGGPSFLSKFPDTMSKIAVLADQLPDGMTSGQQQFVATHFVGSQKLTLGISGALRAINPAFLVLHYHLAIWQSAPSTDFILDGKTWSNDYP